jgi:hypothetical protein
MDVFIGSSREAVDLGLLTTVGLWIERADHNPLPWNEPELFGIGGVVWDELYSIARRVHAAILIFSEDDKTWHRNSLGPTPRDNVMIEYGLFTGVLGKYQNTARVIICRHGHPRFGVDLEGIIYGDLNKKVQTERQIRNWLNRLSSMPGAQVTTTRRMAKEDQINLLQLMKNHGISDINIDFFLSFYQGDQSGTELALKNGANKELTFKALIQKHHAAMQTNAAYRKLLVQLI